MDEIFIQLLKDLVQIASPSEHEQAASHFLATWMREHGLEATVDEAGNAVGWKGTGPREVMLLGHIDTFPGQPPVKREGNLLFGRGSVDAKGPLCTFAAAASQVTVPSGWKLTVVGAVEEECATSKGARHMLTTHRDQPPAFCVIGEPSHWDRLTLGYKGRMLLDVDWEVPFSHSAGEGALPAEQGVALWQTLESYAAEVNQGRNGAFNVLDPSLRSFNTDDAGTYARVRLSIGFRLPTDIEPSALEADLRQRLGKHFNPDTLKLHFHGHEKAHRAGKSNALVRAFLKSIRAQGGKPRFVVKTGTADMNVVGPVWGCPILAYGPGDSSLDHTPHEHIDLREYLQAIAVLRQALDNLWQAEA